MNNYIDEVLKEAKEEWLDEQKLNWYYKQMRFNSMLSRATFMEEEGKHVDESAIVIMEHANGMKGLTPQSRHRMAEEIAKELLAEKGADAYFYCVEKLANNTTAPRLWRDVLTYLDEMKGESK